MKRPRTLRISETAYGHMRLHTEVLGALALLREAEIDAAVLAASRPDYAEVHAAIQEAWRLLVEVRGVLSPKTREK